MSILAWICFIIACTLGILVILSILYSRIMHAKINSNGIIIYILVIIVLLILTEITK